MAYTPAKGRFEYHSPSGRHLGAWGNGAFAGFRGLLESEYQDVLAFQQKVQEQVARTADPDEDPGWSKPLIGPIAQAMFEASKPIVVQANQDTLINTLFNDARAAHGDEQGAYLVYSFRLGTLSLIRARGAGALPGCGRSIGAHDEDRGVRAGPSIPASRGSRWNSAQQDGARHLRRPVASASRLRQEFCTLTACGKSLAG